MRISIVIAIAAAGAAAAADVKPAGSSTAEQSEFFETQVRPLLAEHCQGCHNADDQQGGIRLDRKSDILGQVAGQPIVAPNHPEQSRLLAVIRYSADDIQMPPDGQLPDKLQQTLHKWIATGAYWPAEDSVEEDDSPFFQRDDGSIDFDAAAAGHWSYSPIQSPTVPRSRQSESQHPIDAFVAARQVESGVDAGPRAPARTLLRRLSFDLIGLPPTYEEVAAFEANSSPAATEAVIDRLLASPHYGERWGRHWLDVARYADTTGYRTANKTRQYPHAYTYRDWIVRSLNEDVGYDRFVRAQLAADLIWPDDAAEQAALGFLTVGPLFTDSRVEQINDQIDVVSRGLMGLTMACARCHDHKFDPVPTSDYYSLYGVFDSTKRVDEGLAIPIDESNLSDGVVEFREQLAELEGKHLQAYQDARKTIQDDSRKRLADYFVAAAVKLKALPDAASPNPEPRLRVRSLQRWTELLTKRDAHPAIQLLWELAALKDEKPYAEAAEKRCRQLMQSDKQARPASLLAKFVATPPESFELALRSVAEAALRGDADVAKLLDIKPAPTAYSADEILAVTDRDLSNPIQKAKQAVDDHWAKHPSAPPRAMIVRDERPHDVRVFVRGNIGRRGDVAPRRFPQLFTRVSAGSFRDGSGRLALADAVVADGNPLTARVIVNRVWKHYFGRGLVDTPSDFGLQGDRPTHPLLLDHLASELMAHDWSLKWLHRYIVTSHTYQQSSADRPALRSVDPDNRLLWRQRRKRLEFEPMRDAMLKVAGMLDASVGGKSVPLSNLSRRSIYLKVDRDNPPELMRTFDVPGADQTSPARSETLVPQQALFYLNNDQITNISEQLANRITATEPADQAARLFQLVLARSPTEEEATVAGQLCAVDLRGACRVLLMSNEFLFVD